MNDEILKERWGEVDKLLSTFYTKNQKINRDMEVRLQRVLNGIKYSYDDLYRYATPSEVKRFKNEVDEFPYELSGYTGYQIRSLYKRAKLKRSDILMGLLMLVYYQQMKEQDVEEQTLFDEIAKVSYIQGQIEGLEAQNKKKNIKPLPKNFISSIGGFNGYKWQDYKEGSINYYVKQMFQAIAVDLQQNKKLETESDNISKALKKYFKFYFALVVYEKVKERYISPFFGALDTQITYIVNQAILLALINAGCKRAKFVAVIDDKTTKMCKSLDGQIFYLNKKNKFKRYSASNEGMVEYNQKGLVLGLNLPPIMDHYHHCRSTIFPEGEANIDNKAK